MGDIKQWFVKYDHHDGRKGVVGVTTEIQKAGGFQYGNGKAGIITVGSCTREYDLRYNTAEDLHMVMLNEYFGAGLVSAIEC